jgi:RNA polymerase sigma factor (sigma-70 family)
MSSSRDKRSLSSTRGAIGAAPGKSAPAAAEANRDRDRAMLMARAQAGEREAYRRLLEDIAPFIRALAARHLRDACEVEDAVQDVLLTVHIIRHTYDPTRPFAPWLAAIANRRIVDRLRRQMRRNLRQMPLGPEHETFSVPAANFEYAASDAAALRAAIDNLPSGQRQAIRLLKLEEMSLKEAATASGMSIVALKVATHRALGTLRKMLGNRGRST